MKINYKSDFKVTMTPTISGEPIDVSLHDWDIIFFTHNSVRRYICSKHEDTFTNCHLNEGKIVCVFDNHKLSVGNLLFEFHDYAPDVTYPDGNELTVTPSALDVTLVVGAGDGSAVSGEVVVDVSAAIANANMAADAARAAAERAEAAADEVDVVIGRASGYADAAAASAREAAASAASASSESDEAHGSMVAARGYADNAAASASQAASAVESALVNYYTKSEDNALLAGKADKPLTVNITSEEIEGETVYHADKTTAEIHAAVLAGRNVVAHHDTYEFMLDAIAPNIALFSWSYSGSVQQFVIGNGIVVLNVTTFANGDEFEVAKQNIADLQSDKADKVAVIDVTGSDVTQELQPNTFYRFGTVDSLTLTLAAAPSGVLAIYACSFVAASASTTLTLPASVVGEAPTIAAGSRYELNIMDNVLLYAENGND